MSGLGIRPQKQFGNNVSMSQYRNLTFAGVTAYAGLIPDELHLLYVLMWSLFNRLRSSDVKPSMVPGIQAFAHTVVRSGAELGQPSPLFVSVLSSSLRSPRYSVSALIVNRDRPGRLLQAELPLTGPYANLL